MTLPPPYQRIAVASAFSPRFEQVLAEAKRVRDRLNARLDLVFVGRKTAQTSERFASALRAMGLPNDTSIHYHQGAPAEAILEALRANEVELIIAGALEKQVVLRSFLGNVARTLVREAPCSVLLFTRPERDPKPLRCMVFFVPEYSAHTADALRRTLHLAELEGCEKLYAIRIYTTFDEARAKRRTKVPKGQQHARSLEEEEAALEEFVEQVAGKSAIPLEVRCIRGNTGFAASDFVQSVEADLLVVPAERKTPTSELPPQIAWITDVIPCNLWVIR